MNESPRGRYTAHRERHPHSWFSVRVRRRGASGEYRTLKEIALSDRIVRPAERIRSASTLRMNAHSSPGSATLVRAADRKAETFPRNRSLDREAREVKRKQP